MSRHRLEVSRRKLLQSGALVGAGFVLGENLFAAADASKLPVITKKIPSTGEKIPVIGVGTNSFRESNYEDVKGVLKSMHDLGGTLIDTAAIYTGGESEQVIGRALKELDLSGKMFISTKFNVANNDQLGGNESFERSLDRLQTKKVDLLEVHKLTGLDELMPLMQQYKKEGKIRYLGVTTFQNSEHEAIAELMRKYPLDFIQVDYSLANRDAEKVVFPVAHERGVAVMINVPLGGRRASLIEEAKDRELPKWAADFNVTTWSQFFLKYVVSHPAVTCACPGSTKINHLEDNQLAGHGRLPSAKERKRMEELWDGMT